MVLHTHLRAADKVDFPRGIDLERRVYGNTALWYLWKPSGAGRRPASVVLEEEDFEEGDE